MNRFLAALALYLLALAGAAAQTNVNWGLTTGSNPRNLCVYDSTHVCVTTGTLDSTLHVFTPSVPNGTITSGMLAAGVAAANLGFTPLSPANSLSDLTSATTARTNLGLGTAAVANTGTSGATLCLLNGACVWSGADTFATIPTFTAGQLPPANGGTGLSTFTRSGNTTDFATATGTLTSGHCVSIDASGNFIDAGGACTTGGGGGTVTAGTVGQLAYYSGTTSTGSFALAGDCTFTYPNVTCLKVNGTAFSTLATLAPGTGVASALAASLNASTGLVGYSGALGTPASGVLTNATGLPLSTGVTGTLAAAQEPAHTGDCINTAGSLSLTCTKTNGTSFGTAATQNTGTSGATVPLLNGANTWASAQTFGGAVTVNGAVHATNITTFSPQMYGAICNGSTANASVDTAGFQNAMAAAVLAASNTTAVSPSGVTVDLLGGSCLLNAGFTAANPGTGWISTLRVTNGLLRFAVAVTGNYFIDLSAIGTVYQASIDHIVFKGEDFSGNPNAGGAIKIGEGRGNSINNNVITGFTGSGVLQTTSNYGQGLRIDDNFIQAWTGGPEPASSYCVYVSGGDVYIRGNVIADCSVPVYLGLANQTISNNHIWKYSFTTLWGIIANTGQNIHMTGNYIDTVIVELQGASSGYHFHGNDIVGNHFYMPGGGLGGSASFSSATSSAFIVYEPRVANSGVYQDNISGNAFVNDNGLGGLTVFNNNWQTGSIASGSINGVNITGNTAFGVTLYTSTPLCHITISSATSASCTMGNIPFGTISSLRSSVMSFLTTPTTMWVTRSGTTVTANLGTSATAQVDVTGSINTDYAQ